MPMLYTQSKPLSPSWPLALNLGVEGTKYEPQYSLLANPLHFRYPLFYHMLHLTGPHEILVGEAGTVNSSV